MKTLINVGLFSLIFFLVTNLLSCNDKQLKKFIPKQNIHYTYLNDLSHINKISNFIMYLNDNKNSIDNVVTSNFSDRPGFVQDFLKKYLQNLINTINNCGKYEIYAYNMYKNKKKKIPELDQKNTYIVIACGSKFYIKYAKNNLCFYSVSKGKDFLFMCL